MSEETEMINANKEKSNREAEVNRETNLNYFNENMRNSNANKNLDMNINNLDMPMQMQMSNLQNFNAQNNLPSSLNNISNWNNSNTNNNFSKISRVFIPNTLFVYDTTNSCYTYDLDISKYINYDLVYGGLGNPIYFKTRIFRINSYMSTDWINLDFNNKNHLSGNAICYPETLTIFMSNNKYYNNIHTADDNYTAVFININSFIQDDASL